ncbi:MAG: heme d1 biosynthesis protein NirF [Thermodesulfovibrionales bacterium]
MEIKDFPKPRLRWDFFYPQTLIFMFTLFISTYSFAEKIYVVEREREGLAVIENERFIREIPGTGNMNHVTVKFHDGFAYVISRDGYLAKIDTASDKLLKKVNIGKSGIGFTFINGFIAIANYDPKDVVILDSELNIIKKIETGSRNVGIKANNRFLVFSLMDKDEIWVLDSKKDFEVHRVFKNVGGMPFDALLSGDLYIAGFFAESSLGILDLKNMSYIKKELKKDDGEAVFKIPHFGTWGIYGEKAFIPAVGERKVHILDLKSFGYLGHIDLIGLPVFVLVSPDGSYLAVNYSGDKDDFLSIIDPVNQKVLKDIKAGKRILHIRPSDDGKRLYLSSYFEGKVKVLESKDWNIRREIDVPTPSGIFIVPTKGGHVR